MPRRTLLFGVAQVSAASLMLELTLTRIFSVTLFYHFAFLVVSVALFGIGVAGVTIYARQKRLDARRLDSALAFHAAGFGLAVVLALWVVLNKRVSPGLGWEAMTDLALLYGLCALPFFFSGMALSLAVTVLKEHISRVYFFDLVGASAGCLLAIPAINLLGGPAAVLFAGALGATSTILFLHGRWRRLVPHAAAAGLLWILVAVDAAAGLFAIPSVKAIDEGQVVFSRWNSFSRVTVSKTPEDFFWMNIDSDAATRIFKKSAHADNFAAHGRFSETRLASLIYAVRNDGHALIIGPGGGADVIGALSRGVQRITGVELNGIIVDDVMKGRFADASGRLYFLDGVDVVVGEGRNFVRRSDGEFQSIQATLVDTWAATNAGAFTLSENNLYTVEAFEDFILHLAENGILSMTRWRRHPPREFVRLISLGVAALERLGIEDRSRHFFVAADPRMASFLLKRTPFTPEELDRLREACLRDRLQVIYDPDKPGGGLEAELIRSAEPRKIWKRHPLDITPPSDNRPFFFYTIKPSDFLAQLAGGEAGKNDIGVQILVALLVVVTVAVLLFILLPLFLFGWRDLGDRRARSILGLLYFTAIGVGFIGLEVSWMQHFILFLGHPVHALGVVLFVLLLASGVGSYLTRGIGAERSLASILVTVCALAGVVVLYGFVLGPVFRALVGWPLFLRILIAGLLLGMPGLIMGRMMPLGIKLLTARTPMVVPWAWGVNGAASVLGSVLAVALAMNLGYRATQFIAAGIYLAGAGLFWLAWRK